MPWCELGSNAEVQSLAILGVTVHPEVQSLAILGVTVHPKVRSEVVEGWFATSEGLMGCHINGATVRSVIRPSGMDECVRPELDSQSCCV